MEEEQDCIMSLSDFPEPILFKVFRHLEGAELAKLCTQDRRLRVVAGEQTLWQALALDRWPNATACHHGGDWQQLYRTRARLPNTFTAGIDRLHQLTRQAAGKQQLRMNSDSLPGTASSSSPAGSPLRTNVYGFSQVPYTRIPHMLLDKVMENLFSLCAWSAGRGSTARRNLFATSSSSRDACSVNSSEQAAAAASEMRLVRQDMAWWLSSKPEAVLQYVRRSSSMLDDWDMWGSGFSAWPEVVWRRSALQFLADLQLGPQEGVCPSVTERLQRELAHLDDCIRSVDAESTDLPTPTRPQGLPAKHWWYSLRGQLAGCAC
ncbi:hypothetical protein OEZ86_005144 [Tetradesmus obliquus]|nr:hypothetical protein OEZ86_005144 [Tetradesmus obliquus]